MNLDLRVGITYFYNTCQLLCQHGHTATLISNSARKKSVSIVFQLTPLSLWFALPHRRCCNLIDIRLSQRDVRFTTAKLDFCIIKQPRVDLSWFRHWMQLLAGRPESWVVAPAKSARIFPPPHVCSRGMHENGVKWASRLIMQIKVYDGGENQIYHFNKFPPKQEQQIAFRCLFSSHFNSFCFQCELQNFTNLSSCRVEIKIGLIHWVCSWSCTCKTNSEPLPTKQSQRVKPLRWPPSVALK